MQQEIEVKLIPCARGLSSSCAVAITFNPENKEMIHSLIKEQGAIYDAIYLRNNDQNCYALWIRRE